MKTFELFEATWTPSPEVYQAVKKELENYLDKFRTLKGKIIKTQFGDLEIEAIEFKAESRDKTPINEPNFDLLSGGRIIASKTFDAFLRLSNKDIAEFFAAFKCSIEDDDKLNMRNEVYSVSLHRGGGSVHFSANVAKPNETQEQYYKRIAKFKDLILYLEEAYK